MEPHPFALGWNPESAAGARARTVYAKRGVRAGTPRPGALSLSKYRKSKLLQGEAGTCWVHAAVRLAMLINGAEDLFESVDLCRMMVGYEGKKLEGGGNPTDGGNVSDALTAMTAPPKGIGTCHESLWPYQDTRRALGQKPPAAALSDNKFFLNEVADATDDEQSLDNIADGRGNAIGIWWPYAWDDASKATSGCLYESYGSGVFGHALTEMGYVEKGEWPGRLGKYRWRQLDNWHDELYPPLPAELAALVPGYAPTSEDKTSDFWVREDVYNNLAHGKYAERVTASGAMGWAQLIRWGYGDLA